MLTVKIDDYELSVFSDGTVFNVSYGQYTKAELIASADCVIVRLHDDNYVRLYFGEGKILARMVDESEAKLIREITLA
jgi:hypothetical protein